MARCYLIDVNLGRLASSLSDRITRRSWTEQEVERWLRDSGMTRTADGWLCAGSPSQVLGRESYILLDRYGYVPDSLS